MNNLFKPDFAIGADLNSQRLFVHEMVHVWQYQLGYPVKRVRGPRPNMSYAYTLSEGESLADLNMEAQGNVIADYFLLKYRNGKRELYEAQYANFRGDPIPLYERYLRAFLDDPADRVSLPAVTR